MLSILAVGIFTILDTYALISRCKIRRRHTLHKLLIILLAMAALSVVARDYGSIGLKGYGSERMLSLLRLTVNRSLAMLIYLGITYFFSIPQTILHLNLSCSLKRGKRR